MMSFGFVHRNFILNFLVTKGRNCYTFLNGFAQSKQGKGEG